MASCPKCGKRVTRKSKTDGKKSCERHGPISRVIIRSMESYCKANNPKQMENTHEVATQPARTNHNMDRVPYRALRARFTS